MLLMSQVEPKQALMKGIAAAMAERAADCNPQEISNCVWAFARLSTPSLLWALRLLPLPSSF